MRVAAIILLIFASLSYAVPSVEKSRRLTAEVSAVNKVLPWVVNIGTRKDVRVKDPYIQRLNEYYGLLRYKTRLVSEYYPLGSGIIVHGSGFVLTNWHVVRTSDNLLLNLFNGGSYPAYIVGHDTVSDLCLLKVVGNFEKTPLPSAVFAEADDLLLGETVLAIGNPLGLGHSVSQGILSAINRSLDTKQEYSDMLQTDAAINPGNSGGPLVNLDGNVIGLNQAIRSDAQGIGFSIPVKRMEMFLSSWLLPKTFSNAELGFACVSSLEMDGVMLSVDENGPGFLAGLKNGDVMVAFNGRKISRILDFSMLAWSVKAGDKIEIGLKDGRKVSYVLQEMSPELLIGTRLGIRVQKLTPALSEAMELPEGMKGLAITEILPDKEYMVSDFSLGKSLSRGDIIIGVNEKPVKDIASLYDAIKSGKSGELLMLDVEKMSPRNHRYIHKYIYTILN